MFSLYKGKLKILKSDFNAFLYSLIVFFTSLQLSPLFINGDQEAYRDFYITCFNYVDISSRFECYTSTLGSQEPGYFLIINFFHYFLDKDLLMSFANALFAFLFVKIVYRYYRTDIFIHLFFILIFLNYYTVVLFFSAERLKISIIFLLLSFFLMGWKSYIFKVIMFLTHIQTIFIFLIQIIYTLIEKNKNKIWFKFFLVAGTISVFTLVFLYLREHIEQKFIVYSEGVKEKESGFFSLIKASFFCLLAYLSIRKINVIILQVPLMIGALILGSDRVLIMSFFVYIGCLIYFKGSMDIFGYILLFYFLVKSFDFWQNVMKYGTGFSVS